MNLLAHITEVNGVRVEQTLKDHCLQTARYAAESVERTGLFHTAYLAGLLHDMGKAKREYVEYLEAVHKGESRKRGSVNHTFAGVIYLFDKHHAEGADAYEKLACEVVGYAIGAHHGLFDCEDLDGKNGFVYRCEKDRAEIGYQEAVGNFFSEVASEDNVERLFQKSRREIQAIFAVARGMCENKSGKVFFQMGMLARWILSAVVYGDRRDTSEFMRVDMGAQNEAADWEACTAYFEKRYAEQYAKPGQEAALNRVRSAISEQCLAFAKRPKGIYRLHVPTGGGKTLCSLRYALAHAQIHQKKRVIFLIPLLSVLDQNAKVIRSYVPDGVKVLEHHSNVLHERAPGGEDLDRFALLAESWNQAPIVLSTMVQFLNILFSGKMAAVERMQALSDSVIVMDEVQTLPRKVIAMFNQALNFLHVCCNATIVLSSATQPCYEELEWPLRVSQDPDMVRLRPEQDRLFQRAEIVNRTDPYGMDMETCATFCAEKMDRHPSLLLICNTKQEARELFAKLRTQGAEQGWDTYHLSTAMCQKHRMERMDEIQKRLRQIQQEYRSEKKGRKLVCVSAQLVEAGVDFSFSCVVRVLAGIDNLAQAAGRCNRSNEYGDRGQVCLINLKNENLGMLHEIASAQNSTQGVLEWMREFGDTAYIGEEATARFYRNLFGQTEEIKKEMQYPIVEYGETKYLAKLLSRYGAKTVLAQPLRTVGQKFRVFDDNTTDVLVPYGKGRELIQLISAKHKWDVPSQSLRDILREAKPYMVRLFACQKRKLDDAGMIFSACGGRVWILADEAYDAEYGLVGNQEQAAAYFIE